MSLSDRIAIILGLDTFDRRHKIGLTLLSVALVCIVVLWVFQLRRSISDPLHAPTSVANTGNDIADLQTAQNEADLRAKDTDSDSLNDWDELNTYSTSPYLADTDSDGYNDKQEVETGNDPNCPRGQTCASAPATNTNGSTLNNNSLNALLEQQTAASSTVTATASPSAQNSGSLTAEEKSALKQAVGANADPKTLRQILLQAGMDQKTLDSLSDAQLVQAFNEMIK